MFGKNKKTSFTGLGMILTAIADIMQGIGNGDWNTINWQVDITAIIGGIGFLFAKDGNVTGGTVMQPSSTKALIAKIDEQNAPEMTAAMSGDTGAVNTAPIPK